MTTKRKTKKRRSSATGTTKIATENRRLKTALKKVTSIVKRATSIRRKRKFSAGRI